MSHEVTLPWPPKVSIHAPARGATSGLSFEYRYQLVSIHAPARGATLSSYLHV